MNKIKMFKIFQEGQCVILLVNYIEHLQQVYNRAQWLARWTTVLMVQSSNPLVGECLFPSVIYELLNKIHCIMQ